MRYGLILMMLVLAAGCATDNCPKCDKSPCDWNKDGKIDNTDMIQDWDGNGQVNSIDFSHFASVCS